MNMRDTALLRSAAPLMGGGSPWFGLGLLLASWPNSVQLASETCTIDIDERRRLRLPSGQFAGRHRRHGSLPSTPTAKAEAGEASSVTADTDEPGRVREVGYAGRGRARTLDRGSGTASRCSTVLTVLWF